MAGVCLGCDLEHMEDIISAYYQSRRYKGRCGRRFLNKEDNPVLAYVARRPGDHHSQAVSDPGEIENDLRGQDDITVEDRGQADTRKISWYAENFSKAHSDAPRELLPCSSTSGIKNLRVNLHRLCQLPSEIAVSV